MADVAVDEGTKQRNMCEYSHDKVRMVRVDCIAEFANLRPYAAKIPDGLLVSMEYAFLRGTTATRYDRRKVSWRLS